MNDFMNQWSGLIAFAVPIVIVIVFSLLDRE